MEKNLLQKIAFELGETSEEDLMLSDIIVGFLQNISYGFPGKKEKVKLASDAGSDIACLMWIFNRRKIAKIRSVVIRIFEEKLTQDEKIKIIEFFTFEIKNELEKYVEQKIFPLALAFFDSDSEINSGFVIRKIMRKDKLLLCAHHGFSSKINDLLEKDFMTCFQEKPFTES